MINIVDYVVHEMGIFYHELLLLGHGECVNFFEELGIRE